MSDDELDRTSALSLRGVWFARVLEGWRAPVGPIAQRWLDNDAPLVTGLPAPKRVPANWRKRQAYRRWQRGDR